MLIRTSRCLPHVLGLWVVGCGGSSGPTDASAPGERGNGDFFYACTDAPSDVACGADGLSTQVPAAIAVGGTFGLSFQDRGGSTWPVEASAPSMLGIGPVQGSFEALMPGRVGVFVRSGDRIVDSMHFRLEPLESVDLSHEGVTLGPELELPVGSAFAVEARPSGDLGGALDYAWAVEDETVATVEADVRVATIRPLQAGSTVLRITVEDLVTEYALVATEPPPPRRVPPSASTSGTTGQGTTDSDGTSSDSGGNTDTDNSTTAGTSTAGGTSTGGA